MTEHFPTGHEAGEKELKKKEFITLAEALVNRNEIFPFQGIDPEAYSRLKTDEEECPGYSTPIDELLERFKHEGFKVVVTEHGNSGNIAILPAGSDDLENDNLFPRHLLVTDGMDEALKKLIAMSKERVS